MPYAWTRLGGRCTRGSRKLNVHELCRRFHGGLTWLSTQGPPRFVLGEYGRFVGCAVVFMLHATWSAERLQLAWTWSCGEWVQTQSRDQGWLPVKHGFLLLAIVNSKSWNTLSHDVHSPFTRINSPKSSTFLSQLLHPRHQPQSTTYNHGLSPLQLPYLRPTLRQDSEL